MAIVGENKQDLMSLRSAIMSEFELVAKQRNQRLRPLSDDLVLLECGLDSLSFAIIVARLEDTLGIDPFAPDEASFPVTLREFIRFYEDAAAK